jgi:small subunit ribosomal protein S6
MNEYQLTIVLPEKTSSAKKKSFIDNLEKLVKTLKGEIKKKEEWGEIDLSYQIKKNKIGNFYHFNLSLPLGTAKSVNDKLRVDSDIIRFLLVKVD